VKSRSQRPPEERHARSRTLQLIGGSPVLRGSLVSMARTCGKSGCHCQRGEKHTSLYLAVRLDDRRRMLYVPPAMEDTVRGWVENAREVDRLLDFVSQQYLQQFLAEKERHLGRSTTAGVRQAKSRRKPP
jgi:hypothetical protein